MPAITEAPPRYIDDYERWFDRQRRRFYRQELRDFAFAADIFHFYRDYKDGEAGISVIERYGKDHKTHRLSFRLSPEDIATSQVTTPHISQEHKELLDLLSGPEGIDVTIDLKKVTTREPLGFALKLSPATEEHRSPVTSLVNAAIVFDRESNASESFASDIVMSLFSISENRTQVMGKSNSQGMYTYAHENPELVKFLKTTAFWLQKVISRRHTSA